MAEIAHTRENLQIYSATNGEISSFWKEKYDRDAKKYWDIFYKHHQDKFFKDRHYLDKEWGHYLSGERGKVILEVGCGAGNTIFPLIATYPDLYVHACDFSPRAVDLVKTHKGFKKTQLNAFICDLTVDDLSKQISPSSIDIVTMIFVLSAISPQKMPLVLQNIRRVLKPNGYVMFRDYATGDLAQERFSYKDQKISENFYVRGDGTCAFYFSEKFLINLFKENGFEPEELGLRCKQVENRLQEKVMNRRWVQGVFCSVNCLSRLDVKAGGKAGELENTLIDPLNELGIDLTEGFAVEMFGLSSFCDEFIEVSAGEHKFNIKVLSKEYQHTCNSTGFMLWESARLMASILAVNQEIVAGKRVLEIGCGCGGICSMVASRSADIVFATDGDTKTLDLLNQNFILNKKSVSLCKLVIKELKWGNRDQIQAVKQLNGGDGFEVIIGTDVTYVPEAIEPMFATVEELISSSQETKAALILCHVLRRVDEQSLLAAASQFGFVLIDQWPARANVALQSIISSWFSGGRLKDDVPTTALNIMYFRRK